MYNLKKEDKGLPSLEDFKQSVKGSINEKKDIENYKNFLEEISEINNNSDFLQKKLNLPENNLETKKPKKKRNFLWASFLALCVIVGLSSKDNNIF